MSWKESPLLNENKLEILTKFIEANEVSSKVQEIFKDLLEVETNRDFLTIDHNQRKVNINMSLSTFERNQLSKLLSLVFPYTNISSSFHHVFPLKKDKVSQVVEDLSTKGFYVCENLLDEEVCNSLITEIEKITFHTKKSTKKIKGLNRLNVSSISGNTAWATNQQDLLKIKEVQEIAFDESLLNLVGKFLGAEPVLCQTNCWWSVANSTHRSNLSANAQLFHQDTEYLKFVKVFVYLTDVEKENGPHQYVQGTSTIAQDALGEDYRPSNRVEDKDVERLFGKENILSFTGKKGSVIIEDTFGLHKGTPVEEGSRLLLQLEYCNSLYFHAGYSFGQEGLLPEAHTLAQKNPRIFSNFTKDVSSLNEAKFLHFNSRTIVQKIKDRIKRFL